jgi:hypothetical protein
LYDLYVRFGEVILPELPDVNEVSVENEDGGPYALEVVEELLGVAAKGAEVHVGDDGDVYFSFHKRIIRLVAMGQRSGKKTAFLTLR